MAAVQREKTRFFAFAILRCRKSSKKSGTQADRAFGIKQFTNIVAKLTSMLSNLRRNEAGNWQKIKNSQPQLKFTGSYKKSGLNNSIKQAKIAVNIIKGYHHFQSLMRHYNPLKTSKETIEMAKRNCHIRFV